MSCHSAVDGLHSVREVKSALSQHSATKRCKCTSWMTLLLRDVDLDQFDHMAAEPTHGPHHSCSSSSWLGASDPFLAIGNLFPYGGSMQMWPLISRSDCQIHTSVTVAWAGVVFVWSPTQSIGKSFAKNAAVTWCPTASPTSPMKSPLLEATAN